MGKLRSILSKFFKFQPEKRLTSPVCTHLDLPQKQHYTKLIVNAHDHCRSCQTFICLVCSEVHVQQHCTLDLKVNKEIGQGKLKEFNQGYLMQLPITDIKCICGKPLNHDPNHAICAACGLASCSIQCHTEWQNQGNCTYHLNYYDRPQQVNMRSILFGNIRNIKIAKINEWNLANKSALSYIACYAKAGINHVYLQRGYRNYGKPQPDLLKMMRKIQFNLDFTTHIQRLCGCQCQICKGRGTHSVGNCEYSCSEMEDYNSFKYRDNTSMYFQCGCDCKFCKSGVVVNRHTKIDCGLYCYKSDFNIAKLS